MLRLRSPTSLLGLTGVGMDMNLDCYYTPPKPTLAIPLKEGPEYMIRFQIKPRAAERL